MTGSRPGVLVVGGGLVGRSTAYALCRRDFDVRVIDAATAPSQASRGSLGVLTHFNGGDSPLSRLYRDSHASFAGLAAELGEATGIDIGWRQPGGMDLLFDDQDAAAAEETLRLNRERGCQVEVLDAAAVRRLEPAVAPSVRGGLFFPQDHRVDPEALSEALGAAITAGGGKLGPPERLVEICEATADGVLARTDTGEYRVDFLVLAAGAWTAGLARLVGAAVPVRPIRGQHLRVPGDGPGLVLRHGGHHLVPGRGTTLVGATVEEVGFDAQTTVAARPLLGGAWERMLGRPARLGEQRAGLRPKPKGGRPLIGPLAGTPRVFVATGHYKNGVLMGPVTGRIVAEWMATGEPPSDMSYFRPER